MPGKLLYITLRLDVTGDGASIYAMSNALAFAAQVDTDIITLGPPETKEGRQKLEQAGAHLTAVPEEPHSRRKALALLIKRGHNIFRESVGLTDAVHKQIKAGSYETVVLELYTAYLIDDIRQLAPNCKIVLSQHNYEYGNHLEYIRYRIKSPVKKVLYRLANYRYRQVEWQCLKKADVVIAISEQDRQLFGRIRKADKHCYVMPPALLLAQKKHLYRPVCTAILFLGMMDWYPNIQGLHWFIAEIFNPLLADGHDYHLYVVGKNPTPEVKKYQSPHITVTGSVVCVDDYIRRCDLMVVPNTLGGGVKIKIMEAIQKGIPLLMSQVSAIGYEEVVSAFVVSDPQDFIRRIKNYPEEVSHYPVWLSRAREALAQRAEQNKNTVKQILSIKN